MINQMTRSWLRPFPLLVFVATLATLAIFGCATDDGTRLGSEPDVYATSANPDPATYGTDGFTFNKKMMIRSPNNFMFYYKRCSLTGDHSFYSRTDYFCTEP